MYLLLKKLKNHNMQNITNNKPFVIEAYVSKFKIQLLLQLRFTYLYNTDRVTRQFHTLSVGETQFNPALF